MRHCFSQMKDKQKPNNDTFENLGPRRVREYLALKAMIDIYCHDHHQNEPTPCADCRPLEAYVLRRYTRCAFEEGKSLCVKCRVPCYRRNQYEKINTIIRYARPRLWRKNFKLAWYYFFDGLKPAPTMQDTVNYHRRQQKR